MDEKGLGMRNWDFLEQSGGVDAVLKPVSGFSFPDGASGHQAGFWKMGTFPNRNFMIPEADAETSTMHYPGHSWVHQRHLLSTTKASPNPLQATQINTETGLSVIPTGLDAPTDNPAQNGELGTKPTKIRKKQNSTKRSNHVASEALGPKQPTKKPSASTKRKEKSMSTAIHEKKNLDFVADGITLDFSRIPAPVCFCTGVSRQCYRWGAGGWQSSCCTTSISEHPLPMSSSRPGARMAGRKMSNSAYGKLLQRLAAEGHDLSHSVDMTNHWAKHGTNKFVTIK